MAHLVEDSLILIYNRLGVDADEPRIACVTTDAGRQRVVEQVARARLEVELRWERTPWLREAESAIVSGDVVVYLVSVGTARNLIGLRAFDRVSDARQFAAEFGQDVIIEECRCDAIDWDSLA